jgi:hypothetical protein
MNVNDIIDQELGLEELLKQQGLDLNDLLNELLGLEKMMGWVWGSSSPNFRQTIVRAKAYIESSKNSDDAHRQRIKNDREKGLDSLETYVREVHCLRVINKDLISYNNILLKEIEELSKDK